MQSQSWVDRFVFSSRVWFVGLVWFVCAEHSPLCAQQHRTLSDTAYMREVVKRVDSLIENKYVLPEPAREHAAEFRRKYMSGAYNTFTDPTQFAEQVTADLIEISGDSHFSFRSITASELGEEAESNLRHPVRYFLLGQREHLGYFKLEWIDGGIGLLDLRRFYPLSVSKEMVDAAMLFLSTANAIIIDVRENGGGAGESLQYFCSYFLEYPTQLTGDYSRETNFLTEFWTTAEVAGTRRTDVPVFILTGEGSFSSAETFAYDMQVNGRATLVGDSTGGGAHSVDLFRVDDLFEIYIPTARAINPVTSENWEGTGVVPDVLVPSDVALDTALVLARAAAAEFAAQQQKSLSASVDLMQHLLDDAEEFYQVGRSEEAKLALDSMFRVGDERGLNNEFFIWVLAYNYESEEEILYAIVDKWIELFPESPEPWQWLASVYTKSGRTELAIECYEKVLVLNPADPNAARRIEWLRTRR